MRAIKKGNIAPPTMPVSNMPVKVGKVFLKGSYKNKSKIKLNVSNLKGQFIFLINLNGDEQKKTNLIIQ